MAIGETSGVAEVVQVGAVTVRFVSSDNDSPYSLVEWIAPVGTESPPVHIHHHTDEGFYILGGSFGFLLDARRFEVSAGSHVLAPKGHPHTFWNSGGTTANCLIVLSPRGFEDYFRDLAAGLASSESEDSAIQVRRQLSTTYDIEVVGPPVQVR